MDSDAAHEEDEALAVRWLLNNRSISSGKPPLDPNIDDEILELMYEDSDLEHAWRVLLKMVRLAETEDDLVSIGVGPLETFLREHGARFADRCEAAAMSDPKFRRSLVGVYPHGPIVEVVDRLGLHPHRFKRAD